MLREQFAPQLPASAAFHARVAANALAIVARELEQAAPENDAERRRLQALLQHDGTLDSLNRELCRQIRSGRIAWDDPALARHLTATTLAKVAVDQPNYSGYARSPHRGPG